MARPHVTASLRRAEAGDAQRVLDSSLPAARFYEHRGYAVARHEECAVCAQGGSVEAVLVYAVMEKGLPA